MRKISTKFRQDHPDGAPNARGVGKNCVFLPVEKSSARTPYCRKFVSIRHGSPRPRQCAGGGIRGVINNFGGSRSFLVTVTVQWTSIRLVVWKSVAQSRVTCMWHGASQARCVMVEPTATMRVQNYAGSRIKSESCLNCCSGWHAICLRYSYNSRPTCQLIQSVARVSRR